MPLQEAVIKNLGDYIIQRKAEPEYKESKNLSKFLGVFFRESIATTVGTFVGTTLGVVTGSFSKAEKITAAKILKALLEESSLGHMGQFPDVSKFNAANLVGAINDGNLSNIVSQVEEYGKNMDGQARVLLERHFKKYISDPGLFISMDQFYEREAERNQGIKRQDVEMGNLGANR